MEETILIIIKYIISLLSVLIMYKTLYNNKICKIWMCILSIGLYSYIYIFLNKYIPAEFCGDLLIVITIGMMIDENIKNKIKQLFIVLVMWETIQTIIQVLFINIKSVYERILCQVITLIICLIIYLIYKKCKKKWQYDFNNILAGKTRLVLCVLFCFSMISTQILMTFLDVVRLKINDEYVMNITEFVTIQSVFGLIINVLLFLYVYRVSINQTVLLEREKKYANMQNIYYETIRQKDNKIRIFKHDIENHLLYLYNKAKNNNDKEMTLYIENMNDMIKMSNQTISNVGDEVINIILNYYLTKLDGNIELEVSGKLSEELCEDSFDTNMIIGNAIKNSVEELKKDINGDVKKYLKVKIDEGKKYKRIKVSNTIINKDSKWQMDDKEQHGYGDGIIDFYVKKNNGEYEKKISEDKYEVIITIPKSR